jgi:hypothetical protein
MQHEIALEEQLPRQAFFKVGKSVNSTAADSKEQDGVVLI